MPVAVPGAGGRRPATNRETIETKSCAAGMQETRQTTRNTSCRTRQARRQQLGAVKAPQRRRARAHAVSTGSQVLPAARVKQTIPGWPAPGAGRQTTRRTCRRQHRRREGIREPRKRLPARTAKRQVNVCRDTGHVSAGSRRFVLQRYSRIRHRGKAAPARHGNREQGREAGIRPPLGVPPCPCPPTCPSRRLPNVRQR